MGGEACWAILLGVAEAKFCAALAQRHESLRREGATQGLHDRLESGERALQYCIWSTWDMAGLVSHSDYTALTRLQNLARNRVKYCGFKIL